MPSFNDPIWGVIGVIATIVFGIAGILGVVFTFLQLVQKRKRLSYEIQSITPIFTIAQGFQEQIEIKLSGEIVRDVYLVIVRFVNSGRASMRPEDFARPLKLALHSGRIISADVAFTDPVSCKNLIRARTRSKS